MEALMPSSSKHTTVCVSLGYPDGNDKLRLSSNAPESLLEGLVLGLRARGMVFRTTFALAEVTFSASLKGTPFDGKDLINSSCAVIDAMADMGYSVTCTASPVAMGGSGALLIYFRK